MDALVGNKSKGRNAAIDDSRDIGDLAAIFSDPDKIALLEEGQSVAQIVQQSRPIDERLRQNLTRVRAIQTDVVQGLAEQSLDPATAESLASLAEINRRTAVEIDKRIRAAAFGEDND